MLTRFFRHRAHNTLARMLSTEVKPTITHQEAVIGENVKPAKFNVEDVLSNIDPITNLKKE
jgi:hypothetical protein